MKVPALPKIKLPAIRSLGIKFLSLLLIASIGSLGYYYYSTTRLQNQVVLLTGNEVNLQKQLTEVKKEFKTLENEDQYVVNKKLQEEIGNIQNTYKSAVTTYENLLKLKEVSK